MKSKHNAEAAPAQIIGRIITNGDLHYRVTGVSPGGRRVYCEGGWRLWTSQIDGRGGCPTQFRGRQHYTLMPASQAQTEGGAL